MFVAVAQYPRFADGTVARQWREENSAQAPATPKPILVDRLESQRVEGYAFHNKRDLVYYHRGSRADTRLQIIVLKER
jgi:hypothetical protein